MPENRVCTVLKVDTGSEFDILPSLMGDYPGRRQVRDRVKRANKNDRIIAQRAAEKLAKDSKKAPEPAVSKA